VTRRVPADRPSRRLGAAALLWGAAEATLFFIVPDVLIAWAALRRGVCAGALAALFATAGAAAGGAVVYAWSAQAPAAAARVIEAVPAVPANAVADAAAELRSGGFAAALSGAFRGKPYKVWSAAAPHAGWTLPSWLAAAAPIRLPRFLVVVAGFALLGAALRGRLCQRTIASLFAGGWALFYAAFWLLSPW
jgi:hypothetical protein